jgi:hypothetical protein
VARDEENLNKNRNHQNIILKKYYKKKPKNVLWNPAGFSNQDSIGAMGRREMGKKKGK